ncbi:DUF1329 domain-containing protein [Stutzerimonas stutzeri]|uniref:DUF1329 domain-containing protein n=1 Tax=Stutzerimonas stutzeri TaxID=316 RepID=UPI0024488AA6|nr:DUF1329 domain-containing protein [Stutzerimonas stutzeri]MDH0425417.1 DUF1329 domain-containing protein [Stutzerimonas stutzeri]
MKLSMKVIVAAVSLGVAGTAWAQVSPEELKQLGTTLTPWGAEIAGNADGSIPAFTGGLQGQDNYDTEKRRFANLFADEKPLFSINASNMAQYADKLTPGTQELMKRWPDFRIDVYPTHRTIFQPKERADAALKNAANPECKTTESGVGLRGCWGGTPFPIPKTGYQVMWNGLLRGDAYVQNRFQNWLMDASGNATMINESVVRPSYPYFDPQQTPYEGAGQYYYRMRNDTLSPTRDAGQKAVIWYPLKADELDQRTWSYTTGQRRTRLAPEFSYDTPSASMAGALYYDELSIFSGRMDRFDFELVGKQEMYVPYNTFKINHTPIDQLLGSKFVNPDVLRWELHRVWVVKATRKAGKRHVAAERTFYVDEDSWAFLASEGKDDSGKLFRVSFSHVVPNSQGGSVIASAGAYYDLTKGQYVVPGYIDLKSGYTKLDGTNPDTMFRPESMAGSGVR